MTEPRKPQIELPILVDTNAQPRLASTAKPETGKNQRTADTKIAKGADLEIYNSIRDNYFKRSR